MRLLDKETHHSAKCQKWTSQKATLYQQVRDRDRDREERNDKGVLNNNYFNPNNNIMGSTNMPDNKNINLISDHHKNKAFVLKNYIFEQ